MYKRLCDLPLSIPRPCEVIWSCWGLHLVSPSALFDSPHSVCKQTSFEGDLCEDDPCCQCNQCSVWALFWYYQWLAEPSSRSICWRRFSVQYPGQSHQVTLSTVDDGGCLGCCCSSCAFFFSSIIFRAVDLLTPVSAAVLSHTRFSDSFLSDFFSSMQNLYTFSIIALASIQASPIYWVKSLYMCIIHQIFFSANM